MLDDAELQADDLYNWLSTDNVVVFDLRDEGAFEKSHVRGAYRCWLDAKGELESTAAAGASVPPLSARVYRDQQVVLYADAECRALREHPVYIALAQQETARALRVLDVGQFSVFEQRYGAVACAGRAIGAAAAREGYDAGTRLLPSEILPGKLYLCDLPTAAQLAVRHDVARALAISSVITVMAELPVEMAPVARAAAEAGGEARVAHAFFACHDASGADIKRHFEAAHKLIDEANAQGKAVLVHCSKGVSRSATLCISYLMRTLSLDPQQATDAVRAKRRIVLPNDGFVRCLHEFYRELQGQRSGVYVPKPVVDSGGAPEYALPPRWAARAPMHAAAELVVRKGAELVETLPVGQHVVSVFGRSVTADVPCEHASISRRHCALVQHAAGGFCVVDLGSTHGTFVNGQRLLPHAEVRLQPGDTLVVGASSRAYSLRGLANAQGAPGGGAAAAGAREEASDDDDDDDDDDDGGGGADAGAAARTEKNRLKRKAKWSKFAEKKSLRRLRQIVTQRPLTENEKVAFGAGAGSGCYGPG